MTLSSAWLARTTRTDVTGRSLLLHTKSVVLPFLVMLGGAAALRFAVTGQTDAAAVSLGTLLLALMATGAAALVPAGILLARILSGGIQPSLLKST